MTDGSRTQDGQVSAAGTPELGHPWLSWSWSSALRGLTYALPAGLLVPLDVGNGLAVAVGVIPAAVMPLAPRRAQRFSVVVLGALMGLSILVGSALATVAWLAVVGLFALSVAAALAAASRRDGVLALTLCLPLVAIGFSYDGLATAAELTVLFTLGSVYAWLVSLPWPEQPAVQPPGKTGMPGRRPMLDYGIRVGLAGAVCAAGGFALDLDHVGWPTAAALLVMRPAKEMQQLRSIGRPISVCVGALVAIGLIEIGASEAALAAATARGDGCHRDGGQQVVHHAFVHHAARVSAHAVRGAAAGIRAFLGTDH